MKPKRILLFLAGLAVVLLLGAVAWGGIVSPDGEGRSLVKGKIISHSTADHKKFKQLQQEFKRGPEVTKACLGCHTEAAKQVQQTIHWTWSKKEGKSGKLYGKAHFLNNF
jgi:hypothetical protein